MFDKFKQMKKLRDMQKQMEKKTASAESGGVKVVVNGSMQVTEVSIPEGMDRSDIASNVKSAANSAMKKVQKEVAQEMRGAGLGM